MPESRRLRAPGKIPENGAKSRRSLEKKRQSRDAFIDNLRRWML